MVWYPVQIYVQETKQTPGAICYWCLFWTILAYSFVMGATPRETWHVKLVATCGIFLLAFLGSIGDLCVGGPPHWRKNETRQIGISQIDGIEYLTNLKTQKYSKTHFMAVWYVQTKSCPVIYGYTMLYIPTLTLPDVILTLAKGSCNPSQPPYGRDGYQPQTHPALPRVVAVEKREIVRVTGVTTCDPMAAGPTGPDVRPGKNCSKMSIDR